MARGIPLLVIALIMSTMVFLMYTYKTDIDQRLVAVEGIASSAVDQSDLRSALRALAPTASKAAPSRTASAIPPKHPNVDAVQKAALAAGATLPGMTVRTIRS